MKLTARLLQKLSRGDGSTSPNEELELAVVPIAAGPMTVVSLRERGIDARGYETFNVATNLLSDYRITVPRHQLAESQEIYKAIA
jgi:hypothetical protein